jgi:uncharacterized protein YjiS (DUF1127 family)
MQSGAHAPPGGENMFRILTFKSDRAFWPSAEPPAGEAVGRSAGWLGRACAAVVAEWKARRAIRTLGSMDERMLRDIGINRDQIWYVARHGREAMWRSMDQRPDHTRWS